MKTYCAWLAGGSGLVGSELVAYLLKDESCTEVTAFGRSRLSIENAKLHEVYTSDFKVENQRGKHCADVAFCALGTTIRKAGSKAAFRAVDQEAVVSFAKSAYAFGTHTFVVVSSIGANRNSSTFYLSVKGEMEAAIRNLNFPKTIILRPSLLLGTRKERRVFERIAIAVSPIFEPLLGRYRPVHAAKVAQAMIHLAKSLPEGFHIIESVDI